MDTKTTIGITITAACMLSLTACTPARMGTGPIVSGSLGEKAVEITATVEAIDRQTREVTLKGPEGKVTFVADERVKNLAQVEVGDTVAASYYESLAFDVRKPGDATPGVTLAEAAGTAEPGQRPAALGAQAVTVTSTIVAIDRRIPTVTLEAPDGETRTIKVRNPDNLTNVRVGDLVEITFTQAVAIAVEELP